MDKTNGMQYCLLNRLDAFEFHDAELSLIFWEDNCLAVTVEYLNIHKDAAPDNPDTDMELTEARITFYGLRIIGLEPMHIRKMDKSGVSHSNTTPVIYTDSAAKELFEHELKNRIIVMRMDSGYGICKLLAIGKDQSFSVHFDFDSVKTEWNDYQGKAWYERRQ